MKPILNLLFLLGIGGIIPSFATESTIPKPETSPSTGSMDIIVSRSKRTGGSKRPKAPSAQYISCVYGDGYVSIDFAIPEGLVEMTLTDASGSCSYYEFDSSAPADIFVGYHNEAYIELTTAKGYSYEGCWCLD